MILINWDLKTEHCAEGTKDAGYANHSRNTAGCDKKGLRQMPVQVIGSTSFTQMPALLYADNYSLIKNEMQYK